MVALDLLSAVAVGVTAAWSVAAVAALLLPATLLLRWLAYYLVIDDVYRARLPSLVSGAVLTIVGYAFMRFFIGYLRADGSVVLGNLTITQLQCILLLFTIAPAFAVAT